MTIAKLIPTPKRKASKANSLMGSCSRRREDEDSEFPGFYKCVDYSVLLKGKLKIPRDFCENFEGKMPQQCRLQTLSGTWHVDVKNISGEFFLKKGWKEFVVGNRLKLGECVVFDYIGHAKFYVEIYGHNHCSKSSKAMRSERLLDDDSDDHNVVFVDLDSDSEPRNSEISLESETECPRKSGYGKKLSRRGRAGNSATIRRFRNPCFSVKMCQTHVTKGPLLTPRSFMRNIHKPKKVKLQVGDMAWDVNWIHPYQQSSRFSGGWLHFASQNRLQEGDFCDFELISKTIEVAVMKVSIRKM
ncbi:B3 domain-containing protein Os03g0622200-like isoform X1 [Rosa rugosa]|uniref:B3 domain-containing protein Os03g0622200-like isoform X1 n=2 Tax=Rosa rugosa TaxID=74645 RepID=UPI002B41420E|nr:B3 domain-containing protein Os03g0622200-like isoform X1 [Rosa rugosa]